LSSSSDGSESANKSASPPTVGQRSESGGGHHSSTCCFTLSSTPALSPGRHFCQTERMILPLQRQASPVWRPRHRHSRSVRLCQQKGGAREVLTSGLPTLCLLDVDDSDLAGGECCIDGGGEAIPFPTPAAWRRPCLFSCHILVHCHNLGDPASPFSARNGCDAGGGFIKRPEEIGRAENS
jgi:hypothetical protein